MARIDTSTIEVDCLTASRVGTWTVTLTDAATGQTRDVHARYSFIYRFEGGVWKIQMLHGYITFYVEFDQGWNKGAVPLPQNLEGLAPDAPPTVKYGAFPEVFLPPYHYKNPVTGK